MCFILFFKYFEQCEIIFSRAYPCHDTLFSGSFTLVQTFSVSISYLTLSYHAHELNEVEEKPFTSSFKYPPRSLPQKEVDSGGVTPPSPPLSYFPADPWIIHLKTT
jgi:hypothetical protein